LAIVKPLWIYSHEQFTKRPPDSDIDSAIKETFDDPDSDIDSTIKDTFDDSEPK